MQNDNTHQFRRFKRNTGFFKSASEDTAAGTGWDKARHASEGAEDASLLPQRRKKFETFVMTGDMMIRTSFDTPQSKRYSCPPLRESEPVSDDGGSGDSKENVNGNENIGDQVVPAKDDGQTKGMSMIPRYASPSPKLASKQLKLTERAISLDSPASPKLSAKKMKIDEGSVHYSPPLSRPSRSAVRHSPNMSRSSIKYSPNLSAKLRSGIPLSFKTIPMLPEPERTNHTQIDDPLVTKNTHITDPQHNGSRNSSPINSPSLIPRRQASTTAAGQCKTPGFTEQQQVPATSSEPRGSTVDKSTLCSSPAEMHLASDKSQMQAGRIAKTRTKPYLSQSTGDDLEDFSSFRIRKREIMPHPFEKEEKPVYHACRAQPMALDIPPDDICSDDERLAEDVDFDIDELPLPPDYLLRSTENILDSIENSHPGNTLMAVVGGSLVQHSDPEFPSGLNDILQSNQAICTGHAIDPQQAIDPSAVVQSPTNMPLTFPENTQTQLPISIPLVACHWRAQPTPTAGKASMDNDLGGDNATTTQPYSWFPYGKGLPLTDCVIHREEIDLASVAAASVAIDDSGNYGGPAKGEENSQLVTVCFPGAQDSPKTEKNTSRNGHSVKGIVSGSLDDSCSADSGINRTFSTTRSPGEANDTQYDLLSPQSREESTESPQTHDTTRGNHVTDEPIGINGCVNSEAFTVSEEEIHSETTTPTHTGRGIREMAERVPSDQEIISNVLQCLPPEDINVEIPKQEFSKCEGQALEQQLYRMKDCGTNNCGILISSDGIPYADKASVEEGPIDPTNANSVTKHRLVTSQSAEKISRTAVISQSDNANAAKAPATSTALVRGSKSQENYLDNAEMGLYAISFDDEFSSSVDALHHGDHVKSLPATSHHSVESSPINNGDTGMIEQTQSLNNSPMKGVPQEKVLIPSFFSFEEVTPIKKKSLDHSAKEETGDTRSTRSKSQGEKRKSPKKSPKRTKTDKGDASLGTRVCEPTAEASLVIELEDERLRVVIQEHPSQDPSNDQPSAEVLPVKDEQQTVTEENGRIEARIETDNKEEQKCPEGGSVNTASVCVTNKEEQGSATEVRTINGEKRGTEKSAIKNTSKDKLVFKFNNDSTRLDRAPIATHESSAIKIRDYSRPPKSPRKQSRHKEVKSEGSSPAHSAALQSANSSTVALSTTSPASTRKAAKRTTSAGSAPMYNSSPKLSSDSGVRIPNQSGSPIKHRSPKKQRPGPKPGPDSSAPGDPLCSNNIARIEMAKADVAGMAKAKVPVFSAPNDFMTPSYRPVAKSLGNGQLDPLHVIIPQGSPSKTLKLPSPDADLDAVFHQPMKEADKPSAARLAKRLYNLEGFQKSDISKHLSKKNDFAQSVGEEYLRYFYFTEDTLDEALRKFLDRITLIGETQERERVLVHFSHRYLECNPGTFHSADSCHTLVCALLLLNTDLHGQSYGRKMTLNEFIDNLKGLHDGTDFPRETLKALYFAIKHQPLDMDLEDSTATVTSVNSGPSLVSAGGALGPNSFLTIPDANQTVEFRKGYVMRKCCVDADGRKTPVGKRGWKMWYAVLRDMVLYLYKDEHYFKKSQGSSDTNTNIIRVHHSLVTKAADYRKKQHVFRLQTADCAQCLLQCSSSEECQQWIDAINYAAASLSAPPLPGAVGSQKRFQRPLLPCGYTRLNLVDQLRHHELKLTQLESELQDHRGNVPEKGSKTRDIHDHAEKDHYLTHEVKRFKTYRNTLYSRVSSMCPNLEPSLVETAICEIPEYHSSQDASSKGASSEPSAPLTNKPSSPRKSPSSSRSHRNSSNVTRSHSERYSYRATVYGVPK